MSAAILQGVPATTIDTDIWVELPARQFVRLTALIHKQSGTMLAPTVAALQDDSIINFLPRVDGLGKFDEVLAESPRLPWNGMEVPVLSLDNILKSKRFVGRPKDLAHIPLLEQTIGLLKNRRST